MSKYHFPLEVTAMMFPLFPLLLLITAIGSGLWYQRTNNDIFGVLAVLSALISLIWGLVVLHWTLNLLVLVLLLKFRSSVLRLV
jgi:uncharacterized protein HemY